MATSLPPLATNNSGITAANNVNNIAQHVVPRVSPFIVPYKCQAMIAVLEDTMDQLAVLGGITPDNASAKRIDHPKQLGDKISRIIADRQNLQVRYDNIVSRQSELRGQANKSGFRDSQVAAADIAHEYLQSTQALAKNLKSHPSVAQNLQKIQTERSALQTLVARTLRELRDCHFDSLVHNVTEEYKKRDLLEHTIERERKASELLRQLQQELVAEKQTLESETAERNLVIQQLKDTIQEINTLTTSEQKYIKKEMRAHEISVKQRCQQKEMLLLEEKQTLEVKIALEKQAHDKIMQFLARQREGLDGQIQDWMTRYEEDTERKTNDLEALKQQRTNDLDAFEELVAKYEALERVVDEHKQAKVREAELKKLHEQQTKAASLLQKWWRRVLEKRAQSASAGKKGKGRKASGRKGSSKDKKKGKK